RENAQEIRIPQISWGIGSRREITAAASKDLVRRFSENVTIRQDAVDIADRFGAPGVAVGGWR
ncbi:MAG: hypothetical protein ACLFTB_03765, partial [Desulfovibrionales bacterium]